MGNFSVSDVLFSVAGVSVAESAIIGIVVIAGGGAELFVDAPACSSFTCTVQFLQLTWNFSYLKQIFQLQ